MILPKAEPLGGSCTCGATSTTRIARIAMCEECATELRDLARGQLMARRDGVGLGRQSGPLRPDWGPDWADLECELCAAGWVGPIGEPCGYCSQRVDVQRVEQRLLLLHPELPERGDQRRAEALKAWAQRLANAVTAAVVDEHEARTTWKREQ